MGVCVETLKVACRKELEELSNAIEAEMKSAAMAGVNGKYVTGLAASAVHIEMGEMSAFVGGTDGTGKGITGTDHLAMINDGNGGKRIYAKGNMAEKKETKAVEAEVVEKKQDVEGFIERKMKAINEMSSPAKARRAAVRLLQNRKVGKK